MIRKTKRTFCGTNLTLLTGSLSAVLLGVRSNQVIYSGSRKLLATGNRRPGADRSFRLHRTSRGDGSWRKVPTPSFLNGKGFTEYKTRYFSKVRKTFYVGHGDKRMTAEEALLQDVQWQ